MLNERERWVLFYDFSLRTSPDDAPRITLLENLQELVTHIRAGDAVWVFDNDTAALRVKQMAIYDEIEMAVLHVHFADKKAGDPVFAHLDTGELRTEPKLEGEGVALSAHLLVSTRPYEALSDVYLALLEDVPGVGRTKLRPFVTSLFREGTSFRFKDERDKWKRCRSMVNLGGHQSRTLSEDLERGVLRGVELTAYSQVDGLDEVGTLETVAHKVVMKVGERVSGDDAIGILNRLKQKARTRGFSEMRVHYTRPEGRSKSIQFGTAREDAGDVLSVRSELVKVASPLAQCTDGVSDELVRKMAALLIKERDGVDVDPDRLNLAGTIVSPALAEEAAEGSDEAERASA